VLINSVPEVLKKVGHVVGLIDKSFYRST